jgi:hypothetical protein
MAGPTRASAVVDDPDRECGRRSREVRRSTYAPCVAVGGRGCRAVGDTPARASAATITFVPDPTYSLLPDNTADVLIYTAAAGEPNRLTARVAVSDSEGEVWTFTDLGADTLAPGPCLPIDAHSARCTARPGRYINRVRVDLADLDDTFRWSSVDDGEPFGFAIAHGGPGDDELGGDSGGARVFGDAGDDVLRAGSGFDGALLNGGPGNDHCETPEPCRPGRLRGWRRRWRT